MKVDIKELLDYKKRKLINVQEHPEAPYLIWNYTHKCQNEQAWDSVTKMCRGLITDMDGHVLARPFDKFFNREEHDKEGMPLLPNEPYTVWDKLDGSLGILYFMPDGRPRIATRGSFLSDQAHKATEMLEKAIGRKSVQFPQGYTIMFEIIYPDNRIVVDYGQEEKLVYLGARHIVSGRVVTPKGLPLPYKFESAQQFDMKKLFEEPRENAEGYVLHYRTGMMVKIKFEEYVRLHRIVTGVNKRRIWDLLRNGQTTEELLDHVPEEFEKWVKDTTIELMNKFAFVGQQSHLVAASANKLKTRKKQAEYIKKHAEYPGIAFAMLDGKDYEPAIWKLLKPPAEPPYRLDM